jgi:carbonic anhydrase
MDYPYLDATLRFVKRKFKVKDFDLKADSGGVKTLVEEGPVIRDWTLSNVKTAYHKHGVKTIVLVNHQDCPAYGGSLCFAGPDVEETYQAQQLAQATATLQAKFSKAHIHSFYTSLKNGKVMFKKVEITGGKKKKKP